eukprot:TRINITY_DN44137_c0_g1_i1.p1 TRINITY_DN44137_c0_g1~~TRINITY_DN44137_c0_g1_i1.p1  ORF type:complete len:314 (+),score=40.72 TRINITY_DN44137_c0_g1_i1:58-999(+)
MITLITIKCLSVAVLFAVGFAGGLLPLRLKTRHIRDSAVMACNAFAGGVLLAAALVHMLPEAAKALEVQHRTTFQDTDSCFPLAQTIGGLSFLLLALLEAATFRIHSAGHAHSRSSGTQDAAHTHHLLGTSTAWSANDNELPRQACCAAEQLHLVCSDSGHSLSAATSEGSVATGVFFFALATHSLLEGVGLGVQPTVPEFAAVLLSVLAHKGLAGFALGVQLIRYCSFWQVLFNVSVFSVCSPAGMLLGTLVSSHTGATQQALALAFAAGTFLYIAIPELLMPSFQAASHREANIGVAAVGFLSMAFLALWA